MTAIEQLDLVLSIFISHREYSAMHIGSIHGYVKENGLDISHDRLQEILFKLEKDSFIRIERATAYTPMPVANVRYYILTFEGEVFIENGGYGSKNRKETISTNLQSLATWLIVLGTVLAGCYGLFEILKYYQVIHPPKAIIAPIQPKELPKAKK